MANETQEIGDIVKKCKILLLDIEGTTTSISFVKDKLFPYAEEHVQKFLEAEWEKEDVKEAVAALRKLALEDQENKVDGAVAIPGEDASKEEQITGLVGSVKWQMSADRKAGPLKQLQGLIWQQGYDKGDIKGHVYDDVAAALEQWRSTEGHKIYIYSSGSVQAQKLLFGQSLAGDLLPRIDGHFDTAVGHKQEAASYTAISEKIGAKPEEILFLTDVIEEAAAARTAGLRPALVARAGPAAAAAPPAAAPPARGFPVIHTLAQLSSNKRKPDPQEDEEMPAKVPKTDAEKDVKETAEATAAAAQDTEAEKMEVETPAPAAVTPAETEEEPVKVVTAIEEITDSNEAVDATVVDVEPVVEEESKTEEKQTDKESAKPENSDDAKPKEDVEMQDGEAAPVAEETPPATTVIEEVTEKEAVADVADDVAPVVEEPPAAEAMEVLQNVGEVLEKECDEILSKVQDVTNLDSIPVKPLLNPIAEETMETENTDSNDIVDRILDTELELEMKQNEILKVSEENGTKTENGDSNEADVKQANGIEDKIADKIVESAKKAESSSVEVATEVKPDVRCAETQVEEQTMETETVAESKEAEAVKVTETETTPEKPVEESKVVEEKKTEPIEEKPVEDKPVEESTPAAEPQPADSTPEQKENETSKPEETSQINGKATNGDTPKINGDSEDASSRLLNGKATENGENGSNGASEQGQGDAKEEVVDIKVKAAPPVDAPADQPTEA